MARIRTIKPEFFDHEGLCELSFAHRLCYIGLWTQADKAGRMEDRPLRLKARIFPFDAVDMVEMLNDLDRQGYIVRYERDGCRYLAIKESAWKEHQRPRSDEPESTIPAPDEDSTLRSVESVSPQMLGKEKGKGEEERRREKSVSSALPLAPREPLEPALLSFPVSGKDGPLWDLTALQVREWSELYPGLDVLGEARQALAWVRASKGRQKTASGMPRFLVNWFSRSVNSGRARSDRGGRGAFTGQELKEAAQIRRAWSYCNHDPKCANYQSCVETIAANRRERVAS